MERIESHACFGGTQEVWQHASSALACTMRFGIYLPPQIHTQACPVLYWLSGLTCTEQNFITKAGAQQYAAQHGIILVAPDTSPRGEHVIDDDDEALGKGAGFYVNATQEPWAAQYRMYDYVVDELPALVDDCFASDSARSICGHSMGGHGALTIALRNPGRYRSVSALAPICALSRVPWGEKALAAYLGDDRDAWRFSDAAALIETVTGERQPLLIDQGDQDGYLPQLQPALLQAACEAHGHPLQLRMRAGYDHSYYFVSTFIGEHIAWHAAALKATL